MRNVFIDTSYFIALVNRQDAYHQQAKKWAHTLVKEVIRCHTSIPIVFEIADGFSRLGRREIGISLLENMSNSDNYILHPFSEATYQNAKQLYLARHDKEWGLTDCYSFELMKELKITQVLTADTHFEQFGYEILLKS
ncbi:MAG: PIN domain-containing protein [candidate division KSB1 bacterium]|jgi:predicted nucleic acid-binding protein|nr:PIN domain-containing protein [candidate division KSB1 bacterium]